MRAEDEMTAEWCTGCKSVKTTGLSKITGKPLCSHCQARRLSTNPLRGLAPDRPQRTGKACRSCLEPEDWLSNPLRNGVCEDREACLERAPRLF